MIKFRTEIYLLTGIILFFPSLINAQETTKNQPLYEVGVLDSIYSEILNETREIYIEIPSSYKPDNNQKYPVVYILDGEVFLPTVCDVHKYYSGGFMPEMVMVGISNNKNRTRDLTTSSIKSNYGMPFNVENGEAINFVKFLDNELIPFIEDNYPVTGFRTLIGHSFGGLFTIYTLLNYPDLFSNFLAIDPSLDWDNQELLKKAPALLESGNCKNKSLFMSLSGQLNMQDSNVTIDNVMQDSSDFSMFARSNIAFSNLIEQDANRDLSFDWKFYPRDLHGTIPLPSIMDGLISLFEWFQMDNTDKINSFDTPKEEILKIVKCRENKLQSHFGYSVPPYPEEILNMSGYMNMDMQHFEKAKMYFELTIEYYPQSANAYDSMADYYETQADLPNAIKNLTIALELSGSDYYRKKIEGLKDKK